MGAALAAGMWMGFNLRATAHTLPISYVIVVTDQDYVHLELSFNPFELASFPEIDTNKNGRLDPEELSGSQDKLTRRILAHLILATDGKPAAAETAGIAPDADSHHATLRAHYRVDARRATITLESGLQDITSSSHLSQVNFLRDGKAQLAQLDAQSHQATFPAPAQVTGQPTLPGYGPDCAPAGGKGAMVALSATLAIVIFAALRQSKRNPTEPKPEKPPQPNPPSTL